MTLIKFLFAISIYLIVQIDALSQNAKSEYLFGDEISQGDMKKYVKKGIIQKGERVLAICEIDNNELNSYGRLYIEKFTILTSKKVVEYDQFGEKVRKSEVLLDSILNIEVTTDNSSIYIMALGKIAHNEKYNEDHLIKNVVYLRNVMSNVEKGQLFYRALTDQWRKSDMYSENRNIYSAFFDENGKYIPRQSELIISETIRKLKSKLDSTQISSFRYSAHLHCFKENILYKIEYEVNKEKYIVLKLKVKNPPKEERDQTEIFFNYKILVKGQHELPYSSRGVDFISAEEISTGNLDELLKFLND